MAIAHDTTTTNSSQTDGSHQVSYNVTVGTLTNSILVVGCSNYDGTLNNRTISGITFNGDALTKLRADEIEGAGGQRTELWYLVNPDSGTHALIITCADGSGAYVDTGAISFSGVDQSTPFEDNQTNTDTGVASITLNQTVTTSNAWIIDVCECASGPQSPGGSQTRRWDQSGSTSSGSTYGPLTPAGGFATSYSVAGTDNFVISGGVLKPAADITTVVKDIIQPGIIPFAR
jgi:hypothetical protein